MNPELRILFTVPDLSPASGGPSRSVPALARALARLGIHSEILSQAPPDGSPVDAGVPTTLVPADSSRFRDLRAVRPWRDAMHSRFAAGGVDVVHDAGLWLPVNHCTATTTSRLGIPRVVSPRGMLEPWALGHQPAKKKAAWQLYQRRDLARATLLHATSADELAGLRSAGLKNPIAMVPNGVELPAGLVPTENHPPRSALFLSRIHPKKGLLDLVRAWSVVRPNAWKMIVAGPDERGHLAEVQRAVREAGVESWFEFIGAVDDAAKWALYRSAELFVMPTYSENFGLVIAEALGSGLPVITTRGTPWREIESHRLGWWIPVGADALATALREATTLPADALGAMGRRGRDWVSAHYAWDALAARMGEVYGWLLGRRERPGCVDVI
jgi:glycosyltransferase involved in cell wall biosynthesis